MEGSRPCGEGMENCKEQGWRRGGGGDERWGTTSWGLWLKATSFLGNRSPVHVIRQAKVGVLAAFFI